MTRYVTRSSGWIPWNDPDGDRVESVEGLHVGDSVDGPRKPEFSGLYDARGEKLFKTFPPVGFGRDKEW